MMIYIPNNEFPTFYCRRDDMRAPIWSVAACQLSEVLLQKRGWEWQSRLESFKNQLHNLITFETTSSSFMLQLKSSFMRQNNAFKVQNNEPSPLLSTTNAFNNKKCSFLWTKLLSILSTKSAFKVQNNEPINVHEIYSQKRPSPSFNHKNVNIVFNKTAFKFWNQANSSPISNKVSQIEFERGVPVC